MDSILFEKQEASLCAQHALNMLLQGSYFSAVDLAEIAHEMDARESSVMERDGNSSHNMDDSGFFSVQVISEALKVFNLELIPFNSPSAAPYRQDPTFGRAYICNLNEHWFAVRRFGFQWFTLNSLLSTPRLISDTYLSLFFAQLANDGYSIFVVEGELPPCTADEVLSRCPVDPALASRSEPIREDQQQDPDLARAIALSLSKGEEDVHEEDEELKRAIETSQRLLDDDDNSLQQAIRESMKDVDGCRVSEEDEEMDRQLQCALQMSLEQNVSNCGVRASEIQDGSKVTVVQDHFDCHTITKRCEDNVGSSEIPDKGAIVNDKPTSELSEGPTPELSEGSSNDVVDNSSQIRKQREQFLKRFDK